MKTVKSDWHCSLDTNTKDLLMRVKIEGPKNQADYHPRAAVDGGYQENDKGDHHQIFNIFFIKLLTSLIYCEKYQF